MALLLSRLGAVAHRHRAAVVLVWLAVLVGGGVGAATLAGETSNAFSIPGQESTTALERIGQEFGAGSEGAWGGGGLGGPAGSGRRSAGAARAPRRGWCCGRRTGRR